MQFWIISVLSPSGILLSTLSFFLILTYFCCFRGTGLLIHYMGTGYGEAWVSASWLQLAGLIILLFGTAIYNGNVITFADAKEDSSPSGEEAGSNKIEIGLAMASPSLLRSPLVVADHQMRAQQYQEIQDEAEMALLHKQRTATGYYQATNNNTRRSNEV
jgi:hypothetical protein